MKVRGVTLRPYMKAKGWGSMHTCYTYMCHNGHAIVQCESLIIIMKASPCLILYNIHPIISSIGVQQHNSPFGAILIILVCCIDTNH